MINPSLKMIVTGGAGFIGSNLVKALRTRGVHVTVIDNLWRGKKTNLIYNGKPVIDLDKDFIKADLKDYSTCLAVIQNADYVFHLADVVAGVDFALSNELFIYQENIIINTNTLRACIENNIPNYIYVGTACSFPKHMQMSYNISKISEDRTYPAEPESSYGWSKLMGEYEADLALKAGKLNVGILRLHNVYGSGASFEPMRSQVIPSLIYKAIRYPKEPFVVWGTGRQYRDFVYVGDIVEALLLMVKKGMNKGVIQVGSEKATTIREVTEGIVRISGKSIEPIFDESRPEGDRGRIADITRARNILGWEPRTSLSKGLGKTYDWIFQQLDEVT
jgi:GDP-D-mannose 3', 5'-epimerase